MTVELRAADTDSESRTVSGYAAVFNQWTEIGTWFREMIQPGSFANAISRSDIRALYNHNPDHLLARTTSGTLKVREDERGLFFEFDMPESRQDLYDLIKRGDLSQCSFAFTVAKEEWRYNKDDDREERVITEFDQIYDVGPVVYPAYQSTSISARAQDKLNELREQRQEEKEDDDLEYKVASEQLELEHDLLKLNC
jgi:HK97 family phage prohead protease